MSVRKKIGILGGGQLGRMFIQNALNYDVEIHILDPNPNAPCSQIAHTFVCGSFNDYQTVLDFGCDLDIITIEIEHVNTAALSELKQKGKIVIPDPNALDTIKDKGLQKAFYVANNIPTSEYILVSSDNEIQNHPNMFPCVQKTRTGGYDGRGVQVLHTEKDLPKRLKGESVVERLVDIKKEIACIVSKNTSGEMNCFQPTELVFDPAYNLVDYLLSPADISKEIAGNAQKIAKDVVDSFQSPGIFSVEMFLTNDDTLLVNETAPRVHNSGHHSIEACYSSQFDQMLRVLLDLPLGTVKQHHVAGMINVLGNQQAAGKATYRHTESIAKTENAFLHLYGKEEVKPGRKMGHITVLGKSIAEVIEKIQTIRSWKYVENEH